MTITMNTAELTARQRYRIAREVADMKQEELARAVGVSRTTIGDWEAGRTEPAASKLLRLAQATNQPLDWFAEGLMVDLRASRDSNPRPSDLEPTWSPLDDLAFQAYAEKVLS